MPPTPPTPRQLDRDDTNPAGRGVPPQDRVRDIARDAWSSFQDRANPADTVAGLTTAWNEFKSGEMRDRVMDPAVPPYERAAQAARYLQLPIPGQGQAAGAPQGGVIDREPPKTTVGRNIGGVDVAPGTTDIPDLTRFGAADLARRASRFVTPDATRVDYAYADDGTMYLLGAEDSSGGKRVLNRRATPEEQKYLALDQTRRIASQATKYQSAISIDGKENPGAWIAMRRRQGWPPPTYSHEGAVVQRLNPGASNGGSPSLADARIVRVPVYRGYAPSSVPGEVYEYLQVGESTAPHRIDIVKQYTAADIDAAAPSRQTLTASPSTFTLPKWAQAFVTGTENTDAPTGDTDATD